MIKLILGAAAPVALIVAAFIAFTMEHHWKGTDAIRPAASEFGFGPRVSAGQRYAATLQPRQALRVRQLQAVPVLITEASGRPIDGASISVNGGMPEHALDLSATELRQLEAFLRSLSGGVSAPTKFLSVPTPPTPGD